MVILEEPYVSEMLINFLKTEKIPVLKNNFSEKIKRNGNYLNLMTGSDFIKQYHSSDKKIYTISEYALDWLLTELKDTELNRQITLLKNKTAFRESCQKLYPRFFFKELHFSELFTLKPSELQFPFVLKPSVGFISAGVYIILNREDWQNALAALEKNFKKQVEIFPETVVGNDLFILESYIEGKEFAIDLYFSNKEPVIINIFEHPFSSEKDVKDRLYITNKKIFDHYLKPFNDYIRKLNTVLNLDRIPVHMELRVQEKDMLPVEINPLRFAGLCLNELSSYITGKHPLHYYLTGTSPDYSAMWAGKEEDTFCFSIIEKAKAIQSSPRSESIKQIYSDILEIRTVENPRSDIEAFVFSKTKDPQELNNILNF